MENRKILVTNNPLKPVSVKKFSEKINNFGNYEVKGIDVPINEAGDAVENQIVDSATNCDAIFNRSGKLTKFVFESVPELEIVQTIGCGYDHIDISAATTHGVVISTNNNSPAPSVAEHTIGLALSALRDLPEKFELCSKGKWNQGQKTIPYPELGSCQVGIVGLGTIGFKVAELLNSFGCDVCSYDPYVTEDKRTPEWPRVDRSTVEEADIELIPELELLFRKSDIVTIHTPLTDETKMMISEKELRNLEDGFLINTGRGGVINEKDLIKLVQEDHFAGVALDVLTSEPPEPDNPLLSARNVYITPHIGGSSFSHYNERAINFASNKLHEFFNGNLPDSVVNPEAI